MKPQVGDTVRVPRFFFGKLAYFVEYTLEECNYCLGFYGEDGPKTPCNFTALSECYEPAPDSESKYWSNYGPYHSDYIQTFEVIRK